MPDSFQLIGVRQAQRRLLSAAAKAQAAADQALRVEGELILAESQSLVPFDEGVLSASGHVQGPDGPPTDRVVTVGYGGAAEAYAVVQHEDTTLRHAGGRQAKYLEQPALQRGASFGARLATAIATAIR